MSKYLEGTPIERFGHTHMKKKIKDHFGSRVIIITNTTKEFVVTLRETADSILHIMNNRSMTTKNRK